MNRYEKEELVLNVGKSLYPARVGNFLLDARRIYACDRSAPKAMTYRERTCNKAWPCTLCVPCSKARAC